MLSPLPDPVHLTSVVPCSMGTKMDSQGCHRLADLSGPQTAFARLRFLTFFSFVFRALFAVLLVSSFFCFLVVVFLLRLGGVHQLQVGAECLSVELLTGQTGSVATQC
jgi:hypothetical protein